MSEMFVESLRNRIGAINTLYERCVSDMTLEQVNHHESTRQVPPRGGRQPKRARNSLRRTRSKASEARSEP